MADLYDQAHAGYKPDDPRLVGRGVVFAPGRARVDVGHGDCRALSVSSAIRAPALALARAPGAPGRGEVRAALSGLGLDAARPTRIFTLRCTATADREGEVWNDAVLFGLGRNRWGLVLTGELALVLEPASLGPPKSSFSCTKVAGLSQRAICSDADLAAWDRSVAEAFRRARDVGDPGAVVAEQKAWLIARDRCGADRTCLEKSLSERTDALMQEQ